MGKGEAGGDVGESGLVGEESAADGEEDGVDGADGMVGAQVPEEGVMVFVVEVGEDEGLCGKLVEVFICEGGMQGEVWVRSGMLEDEA